MIYNLLRLGVMISGWTNNSQLEIIDDTKIFLCFYFNVWASNILPHYFPLISIKNASSIN